MSASVSRIPFPQSFSGFAAFVVWSVLVCAGPPAWGQVSCPAPERVTTATDGTQGDAHSFTWRMLSHDGRFMAFYSEATTLDIGTNTDGGEEDAFVHDRQTGVTTVLPLAVDGTGGNDRDYPEGLSADGRYVVINSDSTDLGFGAGVAAWQMSVYDRQTGALELVSVASDGTPGDDGSWPAVISADGRYVAFGSWATNLVPGDTNDYGDVFVHDRVTGRTERVSVTSQGEQVEWGGGDGMLAISADGRYVVFTSWDEALVPGDTNDMVDVFVHDRWTGVTERVSVASDGTQGDDWGWYVEISADGRFVAYDTWSSTLVPNDTNGDSDVFVHDRATGATERVSVATDGTEGDDTTYLAQMSSDARFLVFASRATTFVPDDTNAVYDAFLHDRQTGTTTRMSVAADGTEANDRTWASGISGDGRVISMSTLATNLAPGDTNGVWDEYVTANCAATTCSLAVVRPVAGELWAQGADVSVFWAGTEPTGDDVVVDLYKGGVVVSRIADAMPNVGFAPWTVPANLTLGDDYWVQVESAGGGGCLAVSNGAFSVVPAGCTLQLTRPNGGEEWSPGRSAVIRWMGAVPGNTVSIDLYQGGVLQRMLAQHLPDTGQYTLSVPADLALGDYKVVVRSDMDGTCWDVSDAVFSVVTPTCSLQVTQPNGGETVARGGTATITWTGAVPGGLVGIRLYRDGFWDETVATDVPDTGSYAWNVPIDWVEQDDYVVMIYAMSDPSCRAFAGGPLRVAGGPCTLEVTSPASGQTYEIGRYMYVRWGGGLPGSAVDIVLFRGTNRVQVLAKGTRNDGSFPVQIPGTWPVADNYRVLVRSATDSTCRDFSAMFSLRAASCTLQLTSPNGGELVQRGNDVDITWTGYSPGYRVDLLLFQGSTFHSVIVRNVYSGYGRYTWTVPQNLPFAANYRIRLRSPLVKTCRDISDAMFSIVPAPCTLQLTSPNGGESIQRGTSTTITWTGVIPGERVTLVLFKKGKRHSVIARDIPDLGTYTWTVPAGIATGGGYKIKIQASNDRICRDFSDAGFRIVN